MSGVDGLANPQGLADLEDDIKNAADIVDATIADILDTLRQRGRWNALIAAGEQTSANKPENENEDEDEDSLALTEDDILEAMQDIGEARANFDWRVARALRNLKKARAP